MHREHGRFGGRRFNRYSKASAKALTDCFVVSRLRKQLNSCFCCESGKSHGAIRRASANTSSAANVSTSPRLYAATRFSISMSQAA